MLENKIVKQNKELKFLTTYRPPAIGTKGAVASPHYLATQVGKEILQKGGHAVEAAIATNITLTVVYPHMCGIGGDLMAIIWDKEEGRPIESNGTGKSGSQVNLNCYKDYDSIPERGPLAAITVPGVVGSWEKLHKQYGKLKWSELFERAIEYAKEGFPISNKLCNYIRAKRDILEKNPGMKKMYFPNGEIPKEGELFYQQDLAESLKLISKKGAEAFYKGEIAEKIVESLKKDGGFLTLDDFRSYEPTIKEPLSTSYRDYTVWQTRPNTQGAAAALILKILDNFDFSEISDNTVNYYHLMTEATKLAFYYRDKHISDEGKMDVNPEDLVSEELGKELAEKIVFDGTVDDLIYNEDLPKIKMGTDTIYLATADKDGNTCSLIQSIYHEFGSAYMPEGVGFVLQNRGTSFELDQSHPNSLEPDKYPFHTIIPAMLTKDGKPFMIYGTMGGEGQPQTQSAMVTRVVDFGYNIQQAIEAPRWLYGRTWGAESDSIKLENRIPDEVGVPLSHLGHEVEKLFDYSADLGHAQGIIISEDNGKLIFSAGADPRGDGIALSW